MEQKITTFVDYIVAQAPVWGGALAILVIGFVIAKIIQWAIAGGINRIDFAQKSKAEGNDIGKAFGMAGFWIVLLYVLSLALSHAGLGEYMKPVEDMMAKFMSAVPNIVAAGLILFIGGVVALVFRRTIESVLSAANFDGWAQRVGVTDPEGSQSLSKTLATIVFVLILLPIITAALTKLDLPTVTGPLEGMLDQFTTLIPNIIGATVVVVAFFYLGRFVYTFLKNTLPALGFDRVLNSLGMLDDGVAPSVSPSNVVGLIAMWAIILIGLMAGTRVLGIPDVTEVTKIFLEIGGKVLLGGLIIGIGIFIAKIAKRVVSAGAGEMAGNLISLVTIVMVTFMGLNAMELGEEIVTIAFGAAAVALAAGSAIAFGFGGRDWAGRKLEEWRPSKKATSTRAKKK